MANYSKCKRCGQKHHILPRHATTLDRRERCINTLLDNLDFYKEEIARMLLGMPIMATNQEKGNLVRWFWRTQKRLTTKDTWVPPTREQRRIKP